MECPLLRNGLFRQAKNFFSIRTPLQALVTTPFFRTFFFEILDDPLFNLSEELTCREFDLYNEKNTIVETEQWIHLFKTEKWFDAILVNPKSPGEMAPMRFRLFRLPHQKEAECISMFRRLSFIMIELNIPMLYSANTLQAALFLRYAFQYNVLYVQYISICFQQKNLTENFKNPKKILRKSKLYTL